MKVSGLAILAHLVSLVSAAAIGQVAQDIYLDPNDGSLVVSDSAEGSLLPASTVNKLAKRESYDCFDIDAGYPKNIHWNDVDQFVVANGATCKPKLELQNGSCSRHMDLGDRCSAFCQVSAFYFFAEPINLMHGKICRYGEGCEIRREQSYKVEISNTEVEKHIFDAAASLSPSANWGFGFDTVPIDIGKAIGKAVVAGGRILGGLLGGGSFLAHHTHLQFANMSSPNGTRPNATASTMIASYTDLPGYNADADVIAQVFHAMAAQDLITANETDATVEVQAEAEADVAEEGSTGHRLARRFNLPYPTITSPAMSIAASFSAHWTNDWTRTYHQSIERASFTSITHKQVPGEGCGTFWAVPVGVAYCGWMSLPRFPKAVSKEAFDWIRTAPDTYNGTIKMGYFENAATIAAKKSSQAKGGRRGGRDQDRENGLYDDTSAAKQMWNVGEGRCPVNYIETPFCQASPLLIPNADKSQPGQALHRTVWRPHDCETGELLASVHQPREIRQQLNFDEFFKYHLKKDARFFNPSLPWYPYAHQKDDHSWDGEDDY